MSTSVSTMAFSSRLNTRILLLWVAIQGLIFRRFLMYGNTPGGIRMTCKNQQKNHILQIR